VVDLQAAPTLDALLAIIPPETRVLFIEAFGLLMPERNSNDYNGVANLLTQTTRTCQARNITIIGTVHATKSRARDLIFNPRERILGSVAWGGFCETVIFIEPVEPTNVSNVARRVLILPRNAQNIELDLAFDDRGRLVPACVNDARNKLDLSLVGFEIGAEISKKQILQWAGRSGASTRTAEYWLTERVDDGVLEKVARGVYRKIKEVN
jgi:hypothetical protein